MKVESIDGLSTSAEQAGLPEWPFSERARTLENNILREILKVTDIPGVISFAGGMPAPELFPYEGLLAAARDLLEGRDDTSLQYSLSRGTHELRQWLVDTVPSTVPLSEDSVLVTSGAQQALDIVGRALLERRDRVITTQPTYVGLIHSFNFYGARLVPCHTDEHGIDPDDVERALTDHPARLIYLVPSYDNPTGRTLSLERRQRIVALAERFGVPVIDDNPYGDLHYDGRPLPSLRLLNPEWTIELRSFSKIISPGLRIGWLHAPDRYIAIFEKVKQSTDLHTNTFCQRLIHSFCAAGRLGAHVEGLRNAYGTRLNVMLEALAAEMPKGISWTRPTGGLFLWVTLPDTMDAEKILTRAVTEKVAFVPGRPFYTRADVRNNFRLNFSNQTEERIREGIARLGRILKQSL